MSRPRKATVNDVVVWEHYDGQHRAWRYGVVVAYRTNVKWGRYRVVITDAWGRNPRGRARWMDSTEFITITGRTSIQPARVYRANEKLGDRGCVCQCCHHVRGFESETD